MNRSIKIDNGRILVDSHPEGTSYHGFSIQEMEELRILIVFRRELEFISRYISLIPENPEASYDNIVIAKAMSEASLIGFFRCFDKRRKPKPLKSSKIYSMKQRDDFDRLWNIRNKYVAHDDNPENGAFSVIARSNDLSALEALSINFSIPFAFLPECEALKDLNKTALEWVINEYERIARIAVNKFNDLPIAVRASAPNFGIKITESDFFATGKNRVY